MNTPETALPADADDGGRTQETLQLLADMGREFVSTGDLNAALYHAVEHITRYIDAEGGALFMLDESGATLTCLACSGETEITGLTLGSDQGIVGRCVQQDTGTIVRDVSKDTSFFKGVDEETGHVTRSILCAPLSVKGERLGAIELINKRGGDGLFVDGDLTLLTAMADSAAMAIVNARMAGQLVEQERLARELELAAEIQRSLLPEADEALPVAGVNVPARTVSGDFYDFFQLDDGRILFNLGDVSGKGMNAALLMAKTASLFRCLGKAIDHPGKLMARINEEICETATRGMFVTMVGGIYDPATGRLRLANAGHEPPLLVGADGTFRELPADAPPLGISVMLVPDNGYPVEDIGLEGGAFYIFTDGLTEGYTGQGQELGSHGVRALIETEKQAALGERLERIIAAVRDSGEALRDDLTMLGVDDSAPARKRSADNRTVPKIAQHLAAIEVPSNPDRLRMVREMISDCCEIAGCDTDARRDIVLAVDEACQNVIRHAYGGDANGRMGVSVWLDSGQEGSRLRIEISDDADPVDPATVRPRDLDDVKPGGLGTHLIREIMDTVDFVAPPVEAGNILRLTKTL
ncbi:MAG: SpoIIE family protein phosphatase [Rhodospirillales bacterium]